MERFRNYVLMAMKLNKTILYATGAFLTLAFVGSLAAPRVSAAIRAAFVEVVIPSIPFNSHMNVDAHNPGVAGPDTGNLGVTNITLTNDSGSVSEVIILGVFTEGSCTPQNVNDPKLGAALEAGFDMHILVQPLSTLTLTYPTPLVFGGLRHGCFVAQGGPVEILVNGFVN
jgi:hypothetical protein